MSGVSLGGIYYLNFGVYYLDMQGTVTRTLRLPKPTDWHFISRFEAFKKMPVAEQNDLFSLKETDEHALRNKCLQIASYSKEVIMPRLELLGDIELMRKRIEKMGERALAPFNTQMVARSEILDHIQGNIQTEN